MNHNLERDLYDSPYIRAKAHYNDGYCHTLYAALCNNEFQKLEVESVLTDQRWSCSWRYAGGIASKLFHDLTQEDYLRYYCSGIGRHGEPNVWVEEGTITDEIKTDLLGLGWVVVIDERKQ
jgi:hypothetical protein